MLSGYSMLMRDSVLLLSFLEFKCEAWFFLWGNSQGLGSSAV